MNSLTDLFDYNWLDIKNLSQLSIQNFLDELSKNDFFGTPIIRTAQLGNQIIFRSTVEIKNHNSSENASFYGTGRDSLASTSLVKAYAEAAERMAMYLFKSCRITPKSKIFQFSDGRFTLSSGQEVEKIPRELINSSGWAVELDPKKSFNNAFEEALERHLLQYSFLKADWSGFSFVRNLNQNGYNIELYETNYTIFGKKAYLTKTKSLRHLGYSYGFSLKSNCDNQNKVKITQSLLESLEPLLIFDLMDEETIKKIILTSNDFLERKMLANILEDQNSFSLVETKTFDFEIKWNDSAKLTVIQFDLKDFLRVPFSIFATYVYSPFLISLTPENLKKKESVSWVNQTSNLNGLKENEFFKKNNPIY